MYYIVIISIVPHPVLHEMYSCRSRRNLVVSREVLTKRRYVLEITEDTRVEGSEVQRS